MIVINTQNIYIDQILVQIRFLPSGDIAVWHPYHQELAELIDNLCRGRGRWDRQYNNWIVFSHFKNSVIDAIKARGAKHG